MELDRDEAIDVLNEILELELAGAVRYTQYSLMVFGHARIPIIDWMRKQTQEALMHAATVGEEVTGLGGQVSLGIGKLLESEKHYIGAILEESLTHERAALDHYKALLDLVAGQDVMLEEYARQMISAESKHVSEVDKMLRAPGDLQPFAT